jgi:hypothetical protein
MIGYAYADLDGNVHHKVASYIEEHDPGFFGRHRHLIVKHWRFDTEDVSSMLRMFREFMDIGIRKSSSADFIKSINYDMTKLKNANQV